MRLVALEARAPRRPVRVVGEEDGTTLSIGVSTCEHGEHHILSTGSVSACDVPASVRNSAVMIRRFSPSRLHSLGHFLSQLIFARVRAVVTPMWLRSVVSAETVSMPTRIPARARSCDL